MQLKTELYLCGTQLRQLRKLLRNWCNVGQPLDSWRVVEQKEKALRYDLEACTKELFVNSDTQDTVLVVRQRSVKQWLHKKLSVLCDTGQFTHHAYAPQGELCFVLHADGGQGSTKIGLRPLNVPDSLVRSTCNIDPLCIYEGTECYSNLKSTVGDLLAELKGFHLSNYTFRGTTYLIKIFLSADHKMHSILGGHAGQSAKCFSIYDLAKGEDVLVAGVPVDSRVRAPLRTQEGIEHAANGYNLAEQARKRKGNITPACHQPYESIFAPPLFFVGADFTLPAPVHNNLGIVTDMVRDLELALEALDRQNIDGWDGDLVAGLRSVVTAREEEAQRSDDLLSLQRATVESLLGAMQVAMDAVAATHDADDDEGSDDEPRGVDGFGWLRGRRQQAVDRARRRARRDHENALGVHTLREQLEQAEAKVRTLQDKQHTAERLLTAARHDLQKLRGPRVCQLQSILTDLGIRKTCYFGHAYVGKYCKMLCSPHVAWKITEAFIGGFDKAQRRHENASWVAATKVRQQWYTRLTKWGAFNEYMGGSVDYRSHPGLVDIMSARVHSYAEFVATNFPSHTPTPKEYFTAVQAPHFIKKNGFCGIGDEEGMESGHLDWGRRWVRYRHSKDRRTAIVACLNHVHVRNNTMLCMSAHRPVERDKKSKFPARHLRKKNG